MPSLSQLRLRADRISNRIIELQCDLRGIERRIRILESRAVGGHSRTVSRDLENVLLEREGVLCNISEAQQALHNLEELIKLNDGHVASDARSCASTPSKKRSSAVQPGVVARQPVARAGTAGSPNSFKRQSRSTTSHSRQERTTSLTIRRTPDQTMDNACPATCNVATSMTSFPASTTAPAQSSANMMDGPASTSASHETASKATTKNAHAAGHAGVHHAGASSSSPSRAAPPSTAHTPTYFHLPLPPQPRELSPPPSTNLSTPPASPSQQAVPSSPGQTDLHHCSAGFGWPQVPDPSAAVNSWLAGQPDHNCSPHSPANVRSVPAGSPFPQQLSPMHVPQGQILPQYYQAQSLHDIPPRPQQPTWCSSHQAGTVQPRPSQQACHTQPSFPNYPPRASAQQPWPYHPMPAVPRSVDANVADIRKVESWLQAVGKARGWDLQLLDDLLAQDLAAVLASDGPSAYPAGGRSPSGQCCEHTAASEPMQAWSNPLALQKFVAECAGRPQSDRRAAGTADTLVNAVQKHLLRRSDNRGAHQHADVLRQSFDLLERGAASSRVYIPASQRRDAHARSGPGHGLLHIQCTKNTPRPHEVQSQMDRDDSFPGFQHAGEVAWPTPMGRNGGNAHAVQSIQTQQDGAWPQKDGQQDLPSQTGGQGKASLGAGAPCGIAGTARRRSGRTEGSRHGRSTAPEQEAVLTVTSSSGEASDEREHMQQRADQCTGGRRVDVQIARSKKAARSTLNLLPGDQQAAASPLTAHGSVGPSCKERLPGNVSTKRTVKLQRQPASPASMSPMAAALQTPHGTADTDQPLVTLARQVSLQSHRLELAAENVAHTHHAALNPFHWIVRIVRLVVRVPWRRRARPQMRSRFAEPEPVAHNRSLRPASAALLSASLKSDSVPLEPVASIPPSQGHAPAGMLNSDDDRVRRSHTRVTRSALFRAQAPRTLGAIYEE